MQSFTCVLVVVYVARKLRPCPSYSRGRDRVNLVLWRSLYRGGGDTTTCSTVTHLHCYFPTPHYCLEAPGNSPS